MAKTKTSEVTVNRRNSKDRRTTDERRKNAEPIANERRQSQRRKVQRRRQIDPTTCERDYTNEEIEFMQALDEYKRASGRMFPTCSEILEVIRAMGYVRMPVGDETQVNAIEPAGEPESSTTVKEVEPEVAEEPSSSASSV